MEPFLNSSKAEKWLSTKDAAKLSGYHPDYIARLCREKKVLHNRLGRTWMIDRNSFESFLKKQASHKLELARELSRTREKEYRAALKKVEPYDSSPAAYSIDRIMAGLNRTRSESLTEKTILSLFARWGNMQRALLRHSMVAAVTIIAIGGGAYVAYTGSVDRTASALFTIATDVHTSLASYVVATTHTAATYVTPVLAQATVARENRYDAVHDFAKYLVATPDTLNGMSDSLASARTERVTFKTNEINHAHLKSTAPGTAANTFVRLGNSVRALSRTSVDLNSVTASSVLGGSTMYASVGVAAVVLTDHVLNTYTYGMSLTGERILSVGVYVRDIWYAHPVTPALVSERILTAYEQGITGFVEVTPRIARVIAFSIYSTGDTVARATDWAVSHAPSYYQYTTTRVAEEIPRVLTRSVETEIAIGGVINSSVESVFTQGASGVYATESLATVSKNATASVFESTGNAIEDKGLGLIGNAARVYEASSKALATRTSHLYLASTASPLMALPATWGDSFYTSCMSLSEHVNISLDSFFSSFEYAPNKTHHINHRRQSVLNIEETTRSISSVSTLSFGVKEAQSLYQKAIPDISLSRGSISGEMITLTGATTLGSTLAIRHESVEDTLTVTGAESAPPSDTIVHNVHVDLSSNTAIQSPALVAVSLRGRESFATLTATNTSVDHLRAQATTLASMSPRVLATNATTEKFSQKITLSIGKHIASATLVTNEKDDARTHIADRESDRVVSAYQGSPNTSSSRESILSRTAASGAAQSQSGNTGRASLAVAPDTVPERSRALVQVRVLATLGRGQVPWSYPSLLHRSITPAENKKGIYESLDRSKFPPVTTLYT